MMADAVDQHGMGLLNVCIGTSRDWVKRMGILMDAVTTRATGRGATIVALSKTPSVCFWRAMMREDGRNAWDNGYPQYNDVARTAVFA